MVFKIKYKNVDEFLNTIEDLPIISINLNEINEILQDENTNAQDIAKVIYKDEALAAKILKIANSVYYSRINQVVSLSEAIVVIGLSNIKNMLYSVSLNTIYEGENDEKVLLELWKHSLSSAIIAHNIAEDIIPEEKDTAYVTSLLHDIGTLILYKYANDAYKKIIEEYEKDVLPKIDVEELVLGFSHSDIGAAIARKWNLPPTIKNAIFYHHIPEEAEVDKKLIYITVVADSISTKIGFGGDEKWGKDIKEIGSKEILNFLGLSKEKIKEYIEEGNTVKTKVETLIESLKE